MEELPYPDLFCSIEEGDIEKDDSSCLSDKSPSVIEDTMLANAHGESDWSEKDEVSWKSNSNVDAMNIYVISQGVRKSKTFKDSSKFWKMRINYWAQRKCVPDQLCQCHFTRSNKI